MIRKMRNVVFVMLFLSLITFPFINKICAEEKSPVKIGLATWTEGPALNDGRAYTRAFKTAIAYVNDEGGILNGRKVEGVITSQGMTGETGKAAALKLCLKEKVKALIGPHWAIMAPSGLSVAKRFNVPFAPDQGGMWLYEQGYPGTLGLSNNARARTMPHMRWVEKKGYKNIVVILSDITYNRDVAKIMQERWEGKDSPVKVSDFIWYPFGQTELQKELTKAVSYQPDYIWSLAHSAPVEVSVMKTLHELNFKGESSASVCLNKEVVDKIPQEISEGVYTHMDFAPDPSIPENKAFTDYWQAQWGPGEMPYRTEEIIWAQTVFLLKAMDAAGTEGDGTEEGLMKIHNAMHSIKFKGARKEPVNLSKEGLGMWKDRPVLQIQNGQLKVIEYTPMVPDDYIPGRGDKW